MGWVLERATGTDLADLISKELWSKLGAERDAYILLDAHQAAYADPGLNMTLRDLGRFSQMVLQGGRYQGRQIVPGKWIEDIRHAGDPGAWKRGPAIPNSGPWRATKTVPIEATGTSQIRGQGHITAIGLAGQLIVIDPASSTVVVKFSSHSSPDSDQYDIEYAAAIAIVHALAHPP